MYLMYSPFKSLKMWTTPLFSDISEQTHRPYPGHYTQLQYRIVGLCRYQHLAFKKNHQENQFFCYYHTCFYQNVLLFKMGAVRLTNVNRWHSKLEFNHWPSFQFPPWKEILSSN